MIGLALAAALQLAAAPPAEPPEPAPRLFQGRVDHLVNAPAPLLNGINSRQLGLVRRLAQEDVLLCAAYTSSGAIDTGRLSPAGQVQAAALADLMAEAARQGAALPANPQRQSLAEEDAAAWYGRLLSLETSSAVLSAAMSGGGGEDGAPELQCRVGLAILTAIALLPADQSANVGAFFLAQSLGGGAQPAGVTATPGTSAPNE